MERFQEVGISLTADQASRKDEQRSSFLAFQLTPGCRVAPLGMRTIPAHSLERIVNENVFPFNPQQGGKKGDRILVVRLSEGSAVLEAASMEVDEKTGSLTATHMEALTSPFANESELGVSRPSPQEQRMHRRKRRRTNWVRLINIAFIVFVTLTVVTPVFLSSALGIAIYASDTDAHDAKIHTGDLMISEIKPVIELNNNDVLLLHNEYTWQREIRRVISKSVDGDMVKLTTSDGIDETSTDSYTVKHSTRIHKVIRVVPMFGYWVMILTSVPTKILVGLTVIAMNLTIQIRRARRLRN